MAINLPEFQELVRERDRRLRDKERAAGAEEAALLRLKKDFGCDTLEDAEREADKAEKLAAKLEAEYEAELARVRKEFGNKE